MQPLSYYEVDAERGFLPPWDPLRELPPALSVWDEYAYALPKLLVSGRVRHFLKQIPLLDPTPYLETEAQWRRAMQALSYLGHAWVWGESSPSDTLPASIALPWFVVAQHLGRPPVLSYASYALDNWYRLDKQGPIELDNIALLQNFLGGLDEEWFILIHVAIEAAAAPILRVLPTLVEAVQHDDTKSAEAALVAIVQGLESIYRILLRMPESCDPYIYYHRVRPYIHGWKNNPSLPEGVYYEGVTAYEGRPQQFRGETGAQSSIIPSLDAALGIQHADDPLRAYLREMLDYMPPAHRQFVLDIEAACIKRDFFAQAPTLKDLYNTTLTWIEKFRTKHLEYAAQYIARQHQLSAANPTAVGTGGTPFMPYLAKHRDETRAHKFA
ncbi:MAG: indoleamine 2,3-dioxygenase [Bacteroidia bacterium]|nr:indoleamine 2,3-dioxygenase [Bacteroidia bacterium]